MVRIIHAFADTGAESYVLREYGNVTRFGWDIDDSYGSPVLADCRRIPAKDSSFTFGLFHPPCDRYSNVHNKPDSECPDYIPEARKEAKRLCDYYAIENVKDSPLNDPVKLRGDAFGEPFRYERHFETNFEIEQPDLPKKKTFDMGWNESTVKWRIEKGYSGSGLVGKHVKRKTVPRSYLEYILNAVPVGF